MTVLVGLVGNDGIVLATDSRTTWQKGNFTYHRDNSKKLQSLTSNIAVMSSGYNSGYQHFLVDYYQNVCMRDMASRLVKLKTDNKVPNDFGLSYLEVIKTFAMAVKNEVKSFVESWSALKVAGGIDFILAGYDGDTPKMHQIGVFDLATPFVPSECERYHFSGVSEVGNYLVNKFNLDEFKLPVEFLKRFAVMVCLETISVSDMCGEPVQMAVIDKENGYRDISGEVEAIKARLDTKNEWLYDELDKLGVKYELHTS